MHRTYPQISLDPITNSIRITAPNSNNNFNQQSHFNQVNDLVPTKFPNAKKVQNPLLSNSRFQSDHFYKKIDIKDLSDAILAVNDKSFTSSNDKSVDHPTNRIHIRIPSKNIQIKM